MRTRARPRNLVWRKPPMVFSQPKISSMPLAFSLAERVGLMPGGAAVNRRATPGGFRLVGVLRDVRGDAELAQLHDEVASVVALVGAECLVAGRQVLGHGERRPPLGCARGARQLGLDGKAVAVLHQHVADEAELALLAVALAEQPGIVVVGRGASRSTASRP